MTAATDLAAWHDANDAYLAAAVRWIRLLLTQHAQQVAADSSAPIVVDPAALDDRPDVSLADARNEMSAAEASDLPPAMIVLARRLGLSTFERDLLLLCVAMELDTRIGALCARVQDGALPFPTFGLAFLLFDSPAWDARSPQNPLRYWRLVELNQPWGTPLTTSALRADERIVNYVKGLSHVDERLAPFVTPVRQPVGTDPLPASQWEIVEEALAALDRDQGWPRVVQLLGRDSESRQLVAGSVAQRLGLTLYRMQADVLPTQPAELETLLRLWQRETLLLPVGLYLDASGIERGAESHAAPLRRFLDRAEGVLFVESRETWEPQRGSHVFDVERPTPAEQRELWQTALGGNGDGEAAELAAEFSLGAASIRRIVAAATADGEDEALGDRLRTRARQHTRLRIDALAQRIDAKATWHDIVLPAPESSLLREIAAHVEGRSRVYDQWGFRNRMNRGFGISALFAGPSGTGKTMAAEVIANELGQSLHRIDLSSVVSKWVGETEKNLQQLFNAADDANGILFFDEADALFGKRTDVQQSQDRFANIEINFLLQRLESYRGLAILATNMKTALDQAFLRRLRFIVNFPFPGPNERRAIWEKVFPPQTPAEGLDFERLAQLPLTGGSVHNVALSAAFLASKRGQPVTMPIVFEAARTELRKIEKPVHEADFKWSGKIVEAGR